MRIEELSGADFDPLSRLLGATWHARHGERNFWQGTDELCERLSKTDKGFVAKDDSGTVLGAILLRSPRDEDHNDTLRMHWLQQRTRLGAMAVALGIDARADATFLAEESKLMGEAQNELGTEDVGVIELLILSPDARGVGIGRKLYEMGTAWLTERGATTVRLLTDDECNWQFYEHMGMRRAMERNAPSSDNPDFRRYIYEL